MRTLPLFALLAACTPDNGFTTVKDYGGVYESSISGQVCDTARRTWLEGATVYTHIIVDDELVATAESTTDAEGWFHLEELRGDTTYTIYVQYGSAVVDMYDVTIEGTDDVELPTPDCSAVVSSTVAVVSGDYDELSAVLSRFGVTDVYQVNGQTQEDITQFLSNAENLLQYEAILFAGGNVEEDVFYDSDGSDAEGVVGSVHAAVAEYVRGGGTIWATDWSYDLVEQLWPDTVQWMGDDGAPNAAQLGEPAALDARVRDRELENALGTDSVRVQFELDTWPVAEVVGSAVDVYETVDAPWRLGMDSGTTADAPVAFSFADGDGRVIYTSWTLDANAADGEDVLRYLIEGL